MTDRTSAPREANCWNGRRPSHGSIHTGSSEIRSRPLYIETWFRAVLKRTTFASRCIRFVYKYSVCAYEWLLYSEARVAPSKTNCVALDTVAYIGSMSGQNETLVQLFLIPLCFQMQEGYTRVSRDGHRKHAHYSEFCHTCGKTGVQKNAYTNLVACACFVLRANDSALREIMCRENVTHR